jgi:hypothetical protein
MAGRPKKPARVPEDDLPASSNDRPPVWRDPGTYIGPERVSACIDRIFGDGPRLTTKAAA